MIRCAPWLPTSTKSLASWRVGGGASAAVRRRRATPSFSETMCRPRPPGCRLGGNANAVVYAIKRCIMRSRSPVSRRRAAVDGVERAWATRGGCWSSMIRITAPFAMHWRGARVPWVNYCWRRPPIPRMRATGARTSAHGELFPPINNLFYSEPGSDSHAG